MAAGYMHAVIYPAAASFYVGIFRPIKTIVLRKAQCSILVNPQEGRDG